MVELTTLWSLVQTGGFPFVLFLIVWLLITERLVPGKAHRRLLRRLDDWEDRAFEGNHLARAATRHIEKHHDDADT